MVERHLAKVNVASSNLVFRSKYDKRRMILRLLSYNRIWRHSQVVRQSSAKALCPSSNLGGASMSERTLLRSDFFDVEKLVTYCTLPLFA